MQVTTCGAAQIFEVSSTTGGRLKAQLYMPLQQGASEIEIIVQDGLEVIFNAELSNDQERILIDPQNRANVLWFLKEDRTKLLGATAV